MKILIVDDDNDKITDVISAIREISESFTLEACVDAIQAFRKLEENKYDLLIVDLLLPIRIGENPLPEGGENLVKEINRLSKLKSPTYIIGLTQFKEHQSKFPAIWTVLEYHPSYSGWKTSLQATIQHIQKAQIFKTSKPKKRRPTLYVEGNTDKKIVSDAISLFEPNLLSQISIKSDKSAGAPWVARKVIIWAFSLHRNPAENKEYLRSIGLLDGDGAGNDAKKEINRKVENDSAGSNTFKVVQLSPTYAKNLIPLCKKGINITVTLEELYPPEIWALGETKGWLKNRTQIDSFLKEPKAWNKMTMSLSDYISSLELEETASIYLEKVFDEQSKKKVAKHIKKLSPADKRKALINFETLVQEIKKYLLK